MKSILSVVLFSTSVLSTYVHAGVIDPKCDPKKLVNGVTKVVGNRCTLDETISDTTKELLGVDHRVKVKKRLERKRIINTEKGEE